MELPESLSVDGLELAVTNAIASPDNLIELPLQLAGPVPFCVEALLLQTIISMARRKDMVARFEELNIQSDQFTREFETALGNPHVVTGLVMAAAVQDGNGKSINKREAKAFNRYLDAMDDFEFKETHNSVQDRANLLCIQGARREYIRPLYEHIDGEYRVRSFSEIRLVIQDIISQLAPTWQASKVRHISESLTQLARELVENSDAWARDDESGNPYRTGVRALILRRIAIDTKSANAFAGSNTHLHAYLQAWLMSHRQNAPGNQESSEPTGQRDFVELSVVDSGPGLARRWLASGSSPERIADLSTIEIEREEEAIAKCFQKWATSSASFTRGLGLFSVAKMLRERGGFMRLRTGRLAYLYGTDSAIKDVKRKVEQAQPASDTPYVRLDDGTQVFLTNGEVDFFLRPWSSEELSPLEGTSYSILLPV